MNAWYRINTYGDPLAAIRKFCMKLWEEENFDEVLFPATTEKETQYALGFQTDPNLLKEFNPFRPLMRKNAASMIPPHLNENPGKRLGAILRPCEIRVLMNLSKLNLLSTDFITLITVDCLSTYSLEDYQWQYLRRGLHNPIQFARQGGVLAYRYRNSCQICSSPQATEADINIHVFGLPVREALLVNISEPINNQDFEIGSLTDGFADESLILSYQKVVSRIVQTNHRTWQRYSERVSTSLPENVELFMKQYEDCPKCQLTHKVCPICQLALQIVDDNINITRDRILFWMNTCAGCGMCEKTCADHLPMTTIFRHLRSKMDQDTSSGDFSLIPNDALVM